MLVNVSRRWDNISLTEERGNVNHLFTVDVVETTTGLIVIHHAREHAWRKTIWVSIKKRNQFWILSAFFIISNIRPVYSKFSFYTSLAKTNPIIKFEYGGAKPKTWTFSTAELFSISGKEYEVSTPKHFFTITLVNERFMVSIYLPRPLHISLIASCSLSEISDHPGSCSACRCTGWFSHYPRSCSTIENMSLLAANSWHLIFQNITRKIPIASC